MDNEKIIEVIIEKINDGYDDYEIEKFLERQEINLDKFDKQLDEAKNKILDYKLKTYPKQNKLAFIASLSLFVAFLLFFLIGIPLLNVTNGIIPLSILGAFAISLSGFYSIIYYKSWKIDFIEKIGKPKLNLQTYILVSSLPTVFLFFIISWNFLEGPGHNLYKLSITSKLFKSLFP
ncbi:hypothetical protein EYY60_21715 [Flavobacterium zhairuonense]|uniref:hypothetical protein n=1 Tax=Flavobacterium zhairuonense TaxID=2493631 RepID=UPI0010522105|nr:hypothetical protein [Flavobacterium zhairuonense]KAF2507127.1 hypothetical protein EYY60_21715 [Flavobacterium zhairuonense]